MQFCTSSVVALLGRRRGWTWLGLGFGFGFGLGFGLGLGSGLGLGLGLDPNLRALGEECAEEVDRRARGGGDAAGAAAAGAASWSRRTARRAWPAPTEERAGDCAAQLALQPRRAHVARVALWLGLGSGSGSGSGSG